MALRLVFTLGLLGYGLLAPPVNQVSVVWGQEIGGNSGDVAAEEQAMAAYADAANFQTGGAIDLAIEGWQAFLADYPQHPMASKAAHYLGVCFMQREEPDYEQAAQAFERALKDREYSLREESLANQGWCLFAAAGTGPDVKKENLQRVLEIYQTLRRESPKTRFLDRVLFYSGEAAYGLKQPQKAIQFYNEMLALRDASQSPLRCDAFYARGVAMEELNQTDQAIASFRQLLDSCSKSPLVLDVHLRLGDLWIVRKEYDKAVESLQNAFDATDSRDDQAYAIFRQGYALVQANRPADAALKYERLAKEFPQSAYAASATLASAQSLYRDGQSEAAREKFELVVRDGAQEASTEASHWLARIALAKGDLKGAVKIAQQQIQRGTKGEFSTDLRLDLAEALSLDPPTVERSIDIFEKTYRDAPEGKLASRALYNAAFSALQIGQFDQALRLAGEFAGKFPEDPLRLDVKFVSAESEFGLGQFLAAAKRYQELVQQSDLGNVQRPQWVLRGGNSLLRARQYDQVVSLLTREIPTLKVAGQQFEAYFLIGQAETAARRPAKSAEAFRAAYSADPSNSRSGDARLLQGRSLLLAGKPSEAKRVWEQLASGSPKTRIVDQARYKLGQLALQQKDYATAIEHYREVLQSGQDEGLQPYAKFGIGFAQIQSGDFQGAVASLGRTLQDHPGHSLEREATLSRGIAYRNLKRYELARTDLESFLSGQPQGVNLGHALYELSLVDAQQDRHKQAAIQLQRIVDEVPNYPTMEKVVYELGWAMQESGQEQAAAKQFEFLVAQYPQTGLAAEAAYFLGQRFYRDEQWGKAKSQFARAAEVADDTVLKEKAYYRMGWSDYKRQKYELAEQAFVEQVKLFPNGALAFDARMMVGESRFKNGDYQGALSVYGTAREQIQERGETSKTLRDAAQRQIRELVLLHGGQSAAQLGSWDESLNWYGELRERFPNSAYVAQVFFETGYAYHQKQDHENALKFYGQVASKYRNELAARARFMMGEIQFADRRYDKALPEFQRVMFGFGAEQATPRIKNWQAKSGFEAGRCGELMMQAARTDAARSKTAKIVRGFYQYVCEKHPNHELATKAQSRLDVLGN